MFYDMTRKNFIKENQKQEDQVASLVCLREIHLKPVGEKSETHV